MKKFFSISIVLLLAIVINLFIPFVGVANSVAYANAVTEPRPYDYIFSILHGIDGSGAGIVDQYWYTKLIKLDGYNKKDIKGTLHYEIVPDESITEPYSYKIHGPFYNQDPDAPYNTNVVTVRKGLVNYFSYDVPFSSDDFVDKKFNQLCNDASTDFGVVWDRDYTHSEEFNMEKAQTFIDIMDHAFLHEWGTIITGDTPVIYRVGKVLQSHFNTLQEYIDYLKANKNQWIKWNNDPETYVTGYGSDWKGWNKFRDEENYGRPLISVPTNVIHLGKLPEFRNGTFKFSQYHTKKFVEDNLGSHTPKRDGLFVITRPIAINKSYDSNGNIASIEKPLFPSVSMAKFHNQHSDMSDNYYYDYNDEYRHDEVYRYIIREKPSSDVPLWHEQESYVLDLVKSDSFLGTKMYIYKNREEADAQKHYIDKSFKTSLECGPFTNEVTKRVQGISHYGVATPTPSPTPDATRTSEPGNGARDLLSWNINFGPAGGGLGFVDQTWYTKLIDLQGYQGKDIEGTLHFELVPDTSAHDEYTVKSKYYDEKNPKDPDNYSKVKVVPGIMTFKYDTPFSSDDFVDEEFNRLTRNAKTDFTYAWSGDKATTGEKVRAEQILKLFSHAFMHEWGTVVTSDYSSVYRVGKVEPSDFQSKEDFDIYDEKMKNNNQWVNWKNDPEKQVTGYKTNTVDFDLKNEAQYNRSPIKLNEHVYKHLAEIPEFVDGTMDFGAEFIPPYTNLSYTLYAITRNIAISKTYDAAGNITSIEKPLFPSVPLLDFYAQHNEKLFPDDYWKNGPFKDIDDCDYVFRYILKEKDATGIDITPMDANIVVEVAYQREYGYHSPNIRMFRDETKAKKNRYTYRTNKDYLMNPLANETTDRLQVGNYLRVKTTPSPNGYPQTGDSNHVWLYIALIGVALTTTILIIRKRKTN